ncbi:galactokinase [Chitinophaga costaii]|uniref:Galactokinase n=1 Tax=Chitinophaga costaii TaxID=1335309 RepID=A0A1C4D960_9BACT|nr:galactokinase [Chitinophaga costaii]PUZ24689.1 galactokinase [Chitinophaga costaii]SCC27889.1 galactokinase [Chitinophaga costaii]
MVQQVSQKFHALFGKTPLIVSSPGRINLIGEHTDYNNGFVMPAAIDKRIVYGVQLNGTQTCTAHAVYKNETISFSLDQVKPTPGWINYLLGVVYELQQRGYVVPGFDCVVDGDIPVGAGLSSSAAVEGGLVMALNELMGLGLSRIDMALIGQKAEHTFPGVLCGIMDQFANLHGRKDQVILLDCRSLEYQYFPFQFPDYKIVLCNTMVHHSLASSEYNVRRQQCEAGVSAIQALHPGVLSLRDATLEQLQAVREQVGEEVFQRCQFVIGEIARTQEAGPLLEKGNLPAFGKLMYETHEGLSRDYGVSSPELDLLVELARLRPEVAGARMMGGGFGGCTINLVQSAAVPGFVAYIADRYQQETGKKPEVYVTTIQDGTTVIHGKALQD